MSLDVDIKFDDNKKIWNVNLEGEIDIYTANDLKQKLQQIYSKNAQDTVIDMQNLDYIDSTGLGILIGTLKRLKGQDKDIYIINTKPNVRKIFTITGLDQIFKLEG